jgi:hypothetical protein
LRCAHLRTDVADIKVDLRSLRDKSDTAYVKLADKIDAAGNRLDTKIDSLSARLDGRIDALSTQLDAKFNPLKDSIASAKVWALALYIALAAAMLGTMARGFGWV